MRVVVFDLGGSHVSAGVVHLSTSALEQKWSTTLDSSASAETILRTLESLVRRLQLRPAETAVAAAVAGLSLAVPNPFDYETGVSYIQHKYGALYGWDIRKELSRRLGVDGARICFLNDATAFLLGELEANPAARTGNVVAITLGTGVGSAFASDGRIVERGGGVPEQGEIWNLPWQRGIVEDVLSAKRIRNEYLDRTGRTLEVREMAAVADSDAVAKNVFSGFGRDLAEVLNRVCKEFQPDRVILGGAIAKSARLFLPETMSAYGDCPICISTLFDDAALIGAAVHWRSRASADDGGESSAIGRALVPEP